MCGRFVVFIIRVKVMKKMLIVFFVLDVYLLKLSLMERLLSFLSMYILELLVSVVLKVV